MNFESWYQENTTRLAKKFTNEVRLCDILGVENDETERAQTNFVRESEKLVSATKHLDKEYKDICHELEVMTKLPPTNTRLIVTKSFQSVNRQCAIPEPKFISSKLCGFDWKGCVSNKLNPPSTMYTYWNSSRRWKDTWLDISTWTQ